MNNDIEQLLDEVIDLMSDDIKSKSQAEKKEILDKINYILELEPLNTSTLFWKGMYYYQNDDYDTAVSVFENVLETDPNCNVADETKYIIKHLKELKNFKKTSSTNKSNTNNSYDNYIGGNLIEKIPCEMFLVIKLITLIVILFFFFKPLIFSYNDNKVLQSSEKLQDLWVNQPSEFNNLRKDEIYAIRKAYVKDSLFGTDDYEPNERVFGQIQDYKPWWGEQKCRPLNYTGDYHESIEGESKQSIQINNPNALVGLSSPYIPWDVQENADFCNSEYSRFIPKDLKYSKKDNLIVAEYEVSKDFPNIYVNISGKGYRYPIQLSGLNALDFGYKYVYAFDTKNIEMFYSNNITGNVEMFRDYLHVGGSCGYKGGCNNISPMQNDKMIMIKALPAEINLKLWKKQPHDKYSKADMYYRIIFKEQ